MSRYANNLFAAVAAVLIMAGSFGALVIVPPAQAALATPVLA